MTTALVPTPSESLGTSSPSESRALTVTCVRLEATGVISITFADPSGAELPEWTPGAHLELALPSGLRRQYSLCGSPENRHEYRVAVLREPEGRGGSRELHDTGLVGTTMTVSGPRNRFELGPSGRYVFIAGGIGITPIMAMVRSLAPATNWRLYYGGRTRESMAFTDELVDLGHDRVELFPQDEVGPLDLDAILGDVDDVTAIYCCGPAALLGALQERCNRRGWSDRLHLERFGASAPAPTRADPGDDAGDDAGHDAGDEGTTIEVELRRRGVTLQVGPEQSILDAMLDVDPNTPFSCSEGYCGTCEVRVLEGTPDHRDEILTDQERQDGRTMFPCVSRALTPRLVLDA